MLNGPRLSLRARLYLFSAAILILFAINVGTHLWGSFARNESLLAYRDTVSAAQLISKLEQNLKAQRQQVLVLATLSGTTNSPLEDTELATAVSDLDEIIEQVNELGEFSNASLEYYYKRFYESITELLAKWLTFYKSYNDLNSEVQIESPQNYNATLQRLEELNLRQTFLAVQRSTAIDRTISITDQITVIGFISSIAITLALVFAMIRSTNASLTRMKQGVERFGSGDFTFRIDAKRDSGEIGDLASTFNEMSIKLQSAIEEVNAARADADSANAAKSRFVSNVSHELRTPLNAIIGYSEMLQDVLGDGLELDRNQFHHDLATIIFSGKQLLNLINDILDLSKIETGKMPLSMECFNPAALLFQICDALAPLLSQNNNKLILDIRKDTMQDIISDKGKVQQIVTNLFSNACKFTERGKITVRAFMMEKKLIIEVSDTGIGMTEEQQKIVFDAFSQAESTTGLKYGGTGLGLAIVQEFCGMLEGEIELDSVPGEGANFRITLPAAR